MNLQLLVPRPGIEPGWVAPLVFETSASTDSAIWALAFCECKGTLFISFRKTFEAKVLRKRLVLKLCAVKIRKW